MSVRAIRRLTLWALPVAGLASATPALAQDLSAAIAGALAHAPAMAEAEAGEAAAKARLDAARAERNPLLRIEGSAGVGRIDNGGFFGLAAGNVSPVALQATAELPLYTGGRLGAASDQARAGAEAARLGSEATRLQTIVATVSAYSDVLTARQLEARYTQLASELLETRRQAELRFHAGEIASSDLAQARARTAEAEAGLAQAQGRTVSAEAALARLTGKPSGALAPLPPLPPLPPTLDEAIDLARAHNPALRQARSASAVARAGVRTARADALPTVGAFVEGAHMRDQFFPGYKADSLAVGLRGRWTVWSGGRSGAQTRAASADLAASEARERAADDALTGAVIDTWQALTTARRMDDAARERHAAAAEALRATRLEAKVGAKPTLAVLDAERESIEADTALLAARAAQTLAAWRLNALTGIAEAPAAE